jgi:hypothetical protein
VVRRFFAHFLQAKTTSDRIQSSSSLISTKLSLAALRKTVSESKSFYTQKLISSRQINCPTQKPESGLIDPVKGEPLSGQRDWLLTSQTSQWMLNRVALKSGARPNTPRRLAVTGPDLRADASLHAVLRDVTLPLLLLEELAAGSNLPPVFCLFFTDHSQP